MKEFFDVYDKDRTLTGQTRPRGTGLGDNEHRLVIHICIFNSKGEMLLQQRAAEKDLWPNFWDISSGGNAIAGENSAQCARRELFEELGVDVDFGNIRPHFTINFPNGFDDYYFVQKDLDLGSLTLQKSEVQSVRWASREEVKRLFDENKFLPYIESFILSLFDLRTQYGVIT